MLWPADEPAERMRSVVEAAEVDCVLTEWKHFNLGAGLNSEQASDGFNPTEWVLLTSGTTGMPKLVVHSLPSLSGHLQGGVHPGCQIIWCTFYDVRRYGGLQVLLRAVIGGSVLLCPLLSEPLGAFLSRAALQGATHFVGTPTHWRSVLMNSAATKLRPRYIRLSGEVADQPILDRLREAFPTATIVHAFASTEAGLACEVDDGRAGLPPSLLDQPSPLGTTLRIVDGALQVRSARVALGYLDAGIIRPIASPDGFVDTVDMLVLQDGRLQFAGRRDQVVNIGGRKVYPLRVEAVLNEHPAVSMSRVFGRTSPILGALVAAEVVCKPATAVEQPAEVLGRREQEQDILAFCRERLALHEVPATLRIVPSIDVTASGKLARKHA